ncbi:Sugar transporter ERD6-like 7 [Morus notabilis]|uniref:Sugar transporter ERD6-like 7 n=1 Tax=Morus notabilis TaxID=981085 RepID=W9SZK3_9ROSA|nr:Sugar transporter ERD6-like 7 [Morus notabilis]
MAIKEEEKEEVREPLFAVEDGSPAHEYSKDNPWMVYLSTFVAVCGSYEFGTCAGYSSPTQSAIREDLNLSLADYSLFGSILTFGAMIGAITSGTIADLVGRKGAMRVYTAFCVTGWLSIYFAKDALALDIGRLATGYGMGAFSYVVPVFIAEIAPKNHRGLLTASNQFMICAGVSVSFIIGNVLTWRALALVALIPCAVLLFGLSFIPESPRWLAKAGRHKEFEASLQKLRGKDADISHEAAEIQDYITTLEQLPKAKLLDLFQKRYLRSIIIGLGLMVCQQFGGINGICFYTSSIFESAGFSPTLGTIIYAIIQVVITGLGAAVVDKVGRKPLLLAHELALQASPILAVTGIMLYIGSFSAGMGAVPWIVMSEIFPINIKGQAGSLATLMNWFGAWLCSYSFNFLMAWSSYGTFIIYAAVYVLAILFIITVVPETKGKTLEQIQAAINV